MMKSVPQFLLIAVALIAAQADKSSVNLIDKDEINEFSENPRPQCEPIIIELCKDLPYNQTSFPNLVRNEDQREAEIQLNTYKPLLHAHKNFAQLKFFLCSVYVPMCTDKVEHTIGPCRPLCETVRKTCEPTLRHFGFPWPNSLNCSKFPSENNAKTMCMVGPSKSTTSDTDNTALDASAVDVHTQTRHQQPVNPPSTRHHDDYACRAQYSMHRGRTIFLQRSQQCALDCRTRDQPFSADERKIATAVALSFAVISCLMALLCLFVLLCRNQTLTLRYPEACLVFLTLSIAVYAATYLIAQIYRTEVSCITLEHINERIYVGAGEQHVPCTVTAVILYYFSTAARMWWLNLCWGWFMSAGLGWSPDSLYLRRFPFHVAAWGVPLLTVVIVLMVKAVDADPLTAVCYVGQQNSQNLLVFLGIREILVLIAGGLALLLGLFTIRDTGPEKQRPMTITASAPHTASASHSGTASLLQNPYPLLPNGVQMTSNAESQSSTATSAGTHYRTGVICSLYLVIVSIQIVCYFVEHHQSERTFAVLMVKLVADWVYGLVAQAWCVAWCFFASLRAARAPAAHVKQQHQQHQQQQHPQQEQQQQQSTTVTHNNTALHTPLFVPPSTPLTTSTQQQRWDRYVYQAPVKHQSDCYRQQSNKYLAADVDHYHVR